MFPSRRQVLASLGGALGIGLSGCLSAGSDGSSPSPGATSPDRPRTTVRGTDENTISTGTRTPAVPITDPEACPNEPRVPTPNSEPADIDPIPDPPESFDDSTVLSYVKAYEFAYKRREWSGYGEGIPEFHLSMTTEATAVGEYAVLVTAGFAMAHGRVDLGDGTPYGYFDGARYTFAYLVTEDAVWRAEQSLAGAPSGDPPDPRSEGTLLQCFDE